MITTSLYLGLPLTWNGMMAWAGVNIGRSIETATKPVPGPGADRQLVAQALPGTIGLCPCSAAPGTACSVS
jgi:quinol-cytochrome oxidoreductase complex cytochrome b subunit